MHISIPGTSPSRSIAKMPTGIEGLDEITRGGLPCNRTTLLLGGPGCGKTVMALQTLVNGARNLNEPGIFVTFEENARHIVDNACTFGWDLEELEKEKLFLLDVRIRPETVHSGEFDLTGMLAGLSAKAREMGAKRIVFDAVDVLLNMLDNIRAETREMYRLHDWLNESGLTGILTTKSDGPEGFGQQRYGFLHFMADCSIVLNHRIVDHVSLRTVRVGKYRGSSFSENEVPMVIGDHGIEAASISISNPVYEALTERISTGVARLDTMLEGGYFRGASILIAGAPGSAKSTLCGAFVEAACKRGERALYVGFDENATEIVRNLCSVNIRLAPHVESGFLRFVSTRTEAISAQEHLVKLKKLIHEYKPHCLVIDPVSALLKTGGLLTATGVVERLIHLIKTEGITAVFTSLLDGTEPGSESTLAQVSTMADTWIQLSFPIQGGERNRALTIIKSRGTEHSNQVRELVLSKQGVTLADVYSAGGQVLMGTLRWEKEQAEKAEDARIAGEVARKRREVEAERFELKNNLESLQRDLQAKEAELKALAQIEEGRAQASSRHRSELLQLRNSDVEANRGPQKSIFNSPEIAEPRGDSNP